MTIRSKSEAAPLDVGLFTITLPDDSSLSLADGIYSAMREAIVSGRLTSGQRLPSSRALADELDVSRGTVVAAYEQLRLEGYVCARRGAGTFVEAVPDHFLHATEVDDASGDGNRAPAQSIPSSGRQMPLVGESWVRLPRPFQTGLSPLDGFPRHVLARLAGESVRNLSFEELSYGDPRGYYPLRQAIAAYLRTARAVDCEPDQVFVTNGAQHGLSLIVRVLMNPGEAVWMGNPGYPGALATFQEAGLRIVPVPVDRDGISVEVGRTQLEKPDLIYVNPAHQYPLGVTMSLSRRLELIELAASRNAWIIEDDYDSEYRYDGAPLPALHNLDSSRRVVFVGSFSKVLAPGLRLGYIVAPVDLVDAFNHLRSSHDHHSPILMQKMIARFIQRGQYGRHLRRMRKLGLSRRDALVTSFARRLPHLTLSGTQGGLHAVLEFHPSINDRKLSAVAAEKGLSLTPISVYDVSENPRNGFALGYAAYTEKQIDAAVARLAAVFEAAGISSAGSGMLRTVACEA